MDSSDRQWRTGVWRLGATAGSVWNGGIRREARRRSELLVGAPLNNPVRADLRGYFIVQAADLQRAQQLAVSHPHVKRGGTIVVRRIDPT